MTRIATFLFAALAMLTAACGPQAMIDVQTAEGAFTVSDAAPSARAVGDGLFVLVAEEQDDELALVTIQFADLSLLSVGETVNILDVGVAIEASRGDLEVIERSDGARIVNSQNTRYFPATQGTITLESLSPLAGTFDVDLASGALSGSFVVAE